MEKETIKKEIMNIVSVPLEAEGETGYLKLTDEEIDRVWIYSTKPSNLKTK